MKGRFEKNCPAGLQKRRDHHGLGVLFCAVRFAAVCECFSLRRSPRAISRLSPSVVQNAPSDSLTERNPFTRPDNQFGQGTFKVVDGDFGQGYGLYIYYSAIPEPSSMILAGIGSLAAGWYGRRRRKNAIRVDPNAGSSNGPLS